MLGWKDRKERAIAKMKGQSRSRQRATSALLPVATAALATGIFIADILAPPDVVVSGLYVVVVLMASRFCRPSGVVLVAAGCIGLVLAAYFLSAETAINAAIRIPAIGAAAASSCALTRNTPRLLVSQKYPRPSSRTRCAAS